MSGLKSSEMIFSLSWALSGSDRTQTITCGCTNTSSGTATDVLTAWDLATWNDTNVPFRVAVLDSDYTLINSRVTLNRGGVITNAETIINTAGSGGGTVVSPRVCGNVKKVTGRSNRKDRGRFFMPAGYFPVSNVDELGTIDSTLVANINGDFAQMYHVLSDLNSVVPHILHLASSDVATLINSFVLQPQVATIRHRQPRL